MKPSLFIPGRTELAGNHTDHQNGRVLAAAIDRGLRARFEARDDRLIRIRPEGLQEFELRIDQLSPRTAEFGSSVALVRGMLATFSDLGLKIGGFDAEISSSLPVGAGLSSSAAFCILRSRR